ncbi:MAG: hypothetical protein MUO26_06375, partial [Methanotrichaceae archaeon]|nr:hypothetical protein [Methanotrichaceae archaeon]
TLWPQDLRPRDTPAHLCPAKHSPPHAPLPTTPKFPCLCSSIDATVDACSPLHDLFYLALCNTLPSRVVDQVHFESSRRQFLADIFQLTVLYDCINNTMSHDLPPVLTLQPDPFMISAFPPEAS